MASETVNPSARGPEGPPTQLSHPNPENLSLGGDGVADRPPTPPPHTAGPTGSPTGSASKKPSDDDNDDGWEDEEVLQGLATTHRSRNPHSAVIFPRSGRKRSRTGKNSRASVEKRKQTRSHKAADFNDELKKYDDYCETLAQELADKYNMKLLHIQRRMQLCGGFKKGWKSSLYNIKVGAIMKRLNKHRCVGEKYTMKETKALIKEDSSMLDSFTSDEPKELVKLTKTSKKVKRMGVRASNKAAAADTKATLEALEREMSDLAERMGMVGFAMFSHGHLHDHQGIYQIESHGAFQFFLDILRRDATDVGSLFELWCVNRAKRDNAEGTLGALQKQCGDSIRAGLQLITGKPNLNMNFNNYIKAIVLKYKVGLLGWPSHIPFKCMGKQATITHIHAIDEGLKDGSIAWAKLKKLQQKKLVAEFKEMVANGDREEKIRKQRSDKGGAKGSDDSDSDDSDSQDQKKARKQVYRKGRDDSDKDEDSNGAPAPSKLKPKAKSSGSTTSCKAPEFSIAEKQKALEKMLGKRKARSGGDQEDGEEDRPRKKKEAGSSKTKKPTKPKASSSRPPARSRTPPSPQPKPRAIVKGSRKSGPPRIRVMEGGED
ncbi:hypothetical protein B0H14DRAFT_2651397 [Mycena olivaceomarginata]|nr:hypothetical protein B0H14DRAFT_2651397 [Mycena olivaceomarginata]